ncbi:MAG: TrpR-like protein YerC/YecD [Atopobiaceae bacterium]|nr:TrpR-like protein YerC/YecD [Atopobiaceae bacterium]
MDTNSLFEKADVQRLLDAFAGLESAAEARLFMLDLCTPGEIEDLAQRLDVARRLSEGQSYVLVQQETGASSTTVSRVSKCLNGPVGGYRQILSKG